MSTPFVVQSAFRKRKGRLTQLYVLCLWLSILQQGCFKPIDGIFTITDYDLPNDYEYVVPQSGMHMIVGRLSSSGVVLGYYLNRAYVNDRYIVGEVLLRPTEQDATEAEKFSYFIFDTISAEYISDLTENQFEAELKKLDLWEDVELVDRSSEFWLKNQEPL